MKGRFTLPNQSLEKLKFNGFSTLCRSFAVRVRKWIATSPEFGKTKINGIFHTLQEVCCPGEEPCQDGGLLPHQSLEKLKYSGFSTLCMGFAAVRVKNYAQVEGCYLS
jgi:hypothetical protein